MANSNNKRRKKGSGTLIERNGKWAMRWYEGGRLCQETTPFKVGSKADRLKAEALLEERTKVQMLTLRRDRLAVMIAEEQELDSRITELNGQREGVRRARAVERAATRGGLKLGGLVEAWARSPRRKDCTETMKERYATQIQMFVDWAGRDKAFVLVDDAMAEDYAVHLAGKYSGSTYNKHLNTLTAAWKAVGRSEGVQTNPWADLPRKRLETHVRRALTRAEIAKILKVAEGEVKGLIEIGLATGLRLGDAVRLRWENFIEGGRVVEVTTSKTGAEVRLPGERLRKALGGKSRSRGLILPMLAELYERDDSAVSKLVRKTFEKAGIKTSSEEEGWARARPDASFHSLRHTFVTRAIEAGVPSAIVRALVGHSTAAMTEHYTHVGGDAVLEAFERAGL